jgi:hypothetical protein
MDSRSALTGKNRVVSELEASSTKTDAHADDAKAQQQLKNSTSHLRMMVQEERTVQASLADCSTLLQSDPALFQNTVWREHVAQWFYDVLDYLEESRDLAFVAMNILDRYLAVLASECNCSTDHNPFLLDHFEYEVLSITSLFLAVRITGSKKDLTVPEVLELSASGVQIRHVLSAGNDMLEKVSWDHRIVTPHHFLKALCDHIVQSTSNVVPGTSSSSTALSQSSLFDFAAYLVEVSVCDVFFAQVLPSEVALAAFATALQCDGGEDTATRYQASFALFLQSVHHEIGIDVASPRMKSIISRLLAVYSQSQEAAVSGARRIEHQSDDLCDEDNDQRIILVEGTILNDNDDEVVDRLFIIPQDVPEGPSAGSESIRSISPFVVPNNCSDDRASSRKRTRMEMAGNFIV